MLRPSASNENTVFAPIRVIVWSAAVNSARDAGPVRTRSGAFTTSFTWADCAVFVAAATTVTSLMISVTVLSESGAANDKAHAQSKLARTIVFFIRFGFSNR